MENNFLESVKQQFEYYKKLGERTFDQLENSDIHWQFNDGSNSIAIIVKHLAGNMLSRWTNFMTEDGEKEWRYRDTEFENPYKTKDEMLIAWFKGWKCLNDAIHPLQENDLTKVIYIRNDAHTVIEAINRQLCHYSYHIGQIVYLAKMIKTDDWNSLSIAKNSSPSYNKIKFQETKKQ